MQQRSVATLVFAALLWSAVHQQPSITYLQKSRRFYSSAEFARMTSGSVRMHRASAASDELRIRRLPVHLPVNDFTVIAAESPAITWVGSPHGAVRLNTSTRGVEYFSGQRWLPDDRVTAIGFEKGGTWIETPKGFAQIEYTPMTL